MPHFFHRIAHQTIIISRRSRYHLNINLPTISDHPQPRTKPFQSSLRFTWRIRHSAATVPIFTRQSSSPPIDSYRQGRDPSLANAFQRLKGNALGLLPTVSPSSHRFHRSYRRTHCQRVPLSIRDVSIFSQPNVTPT